VIVSVPYEKMNVECFVYSQEVKDISRLVKDKTRVDVTGDFSRFFTLLDESYTKIEITNAEITIRKGDK
jgi:hypothetical protein